MTINPQHFHLRDASAKQKEMSQLTQLLWQTAPPTSLTSEEGSTLPPLSAVLVDWLLMFTTLARQLTALQRYLEPLTLGAIGDECLAICEALLQQKRVQTTVLRQLVFFFFTAREEGGASLKYNCWRTFTPSEPLLLRMGFFFIGFILALSFFLFFRSSL